MEREAVAASAEAWSWAIEAAPPFELEGSTLASYLGWLERETGWEIAFANETLAAEATAIELHGDLGPLDPRQTPAEVLPSTEIPYRIEQHRLILGENEIR
jgi:hypothetical protein